MVLRGDQPPDMPDQQTVIGKPEIELRAASFGSEEASIYAIGNRLHTRGRYPNLLHEEVPDSRAHRDDPVANGSEDAQLPTGPGWPGRVRIVLDVDDASARQTARGCGVDELAEVMSQDDVYPLVGEGAVQTPEQ